MHTITIGQVRHVIFSEQNVHELATNAGGYRKPSLGPVPPRRRASFNGNLVHPKTFHWT